MGMHPNCRDKGLPIFLSFVGAMYLTTEAEANKHLPPESGEHQPKRVCLPEQSEIPSLYPQMASSERPVLHLLVGAPAPVHCTDASWAPPLP